jgi:hypothetical protein
LEGVLFEGILLEGVLTGRVLTAALDDFLAAAGSDLSSGRFEDFPARPARAGSGRGLRVIFSMIRIY